MRHALFFPRVTGKEGFTLMEMVITLSVIAILTAIMVPIISNNIQSARFARASSDVATLGKAMAEFRKDTSRWPAYEAGGASNDILFSDQDATNDGIPDNGAIPTDAGWGAIGIGQRLSLAYNLIANSSGLYPQGPSTEGLPAWNGPYLSEVRVDPWGTPYVVNSRWLFTDLDAGTPGFQYNNAYVLSAGPGSVLETAFGGAPPADSNDITFRLQ